MRVAEISQSRPKVREADLTPALLEAKIGPGIRGDLMRLASTGPVLENLKDRLAFAHGQFSLASGKFAVGRSTAVGVPDARATCIDADRQCADSVYHRELAILKVYRSLGLFARSLRV